MSKKYTPRERLLIGKSIYDKEMTISVAAVQYGINFYTARDYYRNYKACLAADPGFRIASVEGASPDQISLLDDESDEGGALSGGSGCMGAYGFEEND